MNAIECAPDISIIIPCRNEVHFIDRCLASVFSFEPVPNGYEVLVVDGQSTDGTLSRLDRWAEAHAQLRILKNPARIVPTAMNIGIRAAAGRYIVRLDAHSEYPANYLRLCLETIERTQADNAGGLFITIPRGGSPEARLVQALTTHKFGVGNAGYRLNAAEGYADTVPYGCYRREVFERLGGYDERLVRNQDYEFNRRLLKSGGHIWCNPDIHIHYYNQGSLKGLLRQAAFTGQWNPWMWHVAPYAFALRHAIPGVFVLGLLGGAALARLTPWGQALLALALAAYFSLALVSAGQQARRSGWWMLPILPFLFFAYHVAYGAGILTGIGSLLAGRAPVQRAPEPWPGAGRYRAWPPSGQKPARQAASTPDHP